MDNQIQFKNYSEHNINYLKWFRVHFFRVFTMKSSARLVVEKNTHKNNILTIFSFFLATSALCTNFHHKTDSVIYSKPFIVPKSKEIWMKNLVHSIYLANGKRKLSKM